MKDNILILQNKQDETTNYKSAAYILEKCAGKGVVNLYDGGRHQLFLGENKEVAAKDILEFIAG